MIRGLYTAASGMLAGQKQQEVIADNLANVETTGYKANNTALHDFHAIVLREVGGNDIVRYGPFQRRLIGVVGSGTFLNDQPVDHSQGTISMTGESLDLALQGRGYLALQTPEGIRYTRDGQLRLDAERRLVSTDGFLVLPEAGDGPITLPPGTVSIDAEGLLTVDEAPVAQLRLRDFADGDLVRDGNTRFIAAGPELPADAIVRQGYLERSNVDAVGAMTSAISTFQSYTTMQRAFQVQLDTLQRAITEVGRVG